MLLHTAGKMIAGSKLLYTTYHTINVTTDTTIGLPIKMELEMASMTPNLYRLRNSLQRTFFTLSAKEFSQEKNLIILIPDKISLIILIRLSVCSTVASRAF